MPHSGATLARHQPDIGTTSARRRTSIGATSARHRPAIGATLARLRTTFGATSARQLPKSARRRTVLERPQTIICTRMRYLHSRNMAEAASNGNHVSKTEEETDSSSRACFQRASSTFLMQSTAPITVLMCKTIYNKVRTELGPYQRVQGHHKDHQGILQDSLCFD